MAIEERSFNGNSTRPRPEIHIEKNNELLVVATPWGPRNSARKAIKVILDYFLSSRNDNEATSPFSKLTCLSPAANDLRVAVKLANDVLYSEENKNEYTSGVELFALAKTDFEICWVQIGFPFIFLDRENSNLKPLGASLDLSTELSTVENRFPPLPQQLLGLETSSSFAVQSFRPQPKDKLILLSRSDIPHDFYTLNSQDRNIDGLSEIFSNNDQDLPFWLGIFSA